MAKTGAKVTIKKYANRRLYDTESSAYITLDRLGEMIREGRDFEVVDAKTGDDITHPGPDPDHRRGRIARRHDAAGEFPAPADRPLRWIDAIGGAAISRRGDGCVQQEPGSDARRVQRLFGGAKVFADFAKRNMEMFEEGRAFTASSQKKPPEKDTASEVEKLRAELAALQAKVDKLGSERRQRREVAKISYSESITSLVSRQTTTCCGQLQRSER